MSIILHTFNINHLHINQNAIALNLITVAANLNLIVSVIGVEFRIIQIKIN